MFVFHFFPDEMLRPVDSDGEPSKAEDSDVRVKKARKTRTSFSSEQLRKLEAQFKAGVNIMHLAGQTLTS